jgi:cyclomaltodextrinase / maltogenic alpha-amylase / neopullulanase
MKGFAADMSSVACGEANRLGPSLLVAVVAFILGCSSTANTRYAGEEPRLELLAADADVWAFELDVKARLRGGPAAAGCAFETGDRAWPAQLRGDQLQARVTLRAGDNALLARCHMRDRRELRSQTVHFRVRVPADQPSFESLAVMNTAAADRSWLDTAVGYGVLPPLFGPAGLRDVTEALDRLADLGVNVLWLAPVFETPADDFGYAVRDYFRVRTDYGTPADLVVLTREAHARGMRVLLDLPANHSSREHPYFRQAQDLGARSHYYDFYARDAHGQATHYFDWEHLPNFNFASPEVGRLMFEVARHWSVDFAIDGYRVDAAWGIRQRTPEYWPRWIKALRALRPDSLLVAEASVRDDYYQSAGFDAAYDWTSELGHAAWEHVFAQPGAIVQRLQAAVAAAGTRTRAWRFLNNNDTGKRFITRHGRELTQVATAGLLSLPGIPCLYSFDEVGAEFEPYGALNQQRALDQPALFEFHKRWIHLRRTHPAFKGNGYLPLAVADPDVYAFLRYSDRERLLIVLNFAGEPATFPLEIPGGDRLHVQLAAWDARAIELIADVR